MKSFRKFLGIADITLAVIAAGAAIISNHPQAWFGYAMAFMLGTKGLMFLLWAAETKE